MWPNVELYKQKRAANSQYLTLISYNVTKDRFTET